MASPDWLQIDFDVLTWTNAVLANTAAHTGGLDKILAQGIWRREGLEAERLYRRYFLIAQT